MNPGGEARPRVETLEVGVRLEERVLDHVLGVLLVAREAVGEPEDHPAVLFDEDAEGILLDPARGRLAPLHPSS